MCLKIADGFHYVNDLRVWGFCRACLEYLLEKGQGLFSKAYASNQPPFELDVKSYKKIDYPFNHYAHLLALMLSLLFAFKAFILAVMIISWSFFYHLLVWIVKNKKWC